MIIINLYKQSGFAVLGEVRKCRFMGRKAKLL